jgi:hypothetical protein
MSIEDGSDSKLWKRPEIPVCLKLLLHVKRAECYQNRVIVGLMSVSLMGPYPLVGENNMSRFKTHQNFAGSRISDFPY